MVREKVPFLILLLSTPIYLPMKMEQTECCETSAYKIQTPGNYPKESIQHLDRVEYAVCFRGTIHSKIQTNIKCCLFRA